MSGYKLIAFDMDGTLLDSSKNIRNDSLSAIHDATCAGRFVALSTGRSMSELKEPLKILKDVRYVIGISGALVYDVHEDKIIYKNKLDNGIVIDLIKRGLEKDVMIHIHSDRSIVQKNQASHMADYNMGHYQEMFDNVTLKVDNLIDYVLDNDISVYKLNFYSRDLEQRREIERSVKYLDIEAVYSEITSLECSPSGVSKGSGLIKLCDYMGISLSETIAVGDSDNDYEILKTAGLSVAMGNANDKIKTCADVITLSNDEGGCARVIREYLL